MADLNDSNGTYRGRKSVLDSNCSVSDLQTILDLSQATARIEREVQSSQFAGSSQGQSCLKQLRKSVTDRISSCDLLEIQSQRPSVITPTPPISPKDKDYRVSTPLNQTLPIPPNHSSCVSFGQIDLHIPPNSPTCSEISSIGGEVFLEEVGVDSNIISCVGRILPSQKSIPHSVPTVGQVSSSNMEQHEENLQKEIIRLKHRMRIYTPSHLDCENFDQHEIKMRERGEVLENLDIATQMFVMKFSSQLDQERITTVKNQLSTLEREFLIYRESFKSKVAELKNTSNTASLVLPSMNNLTLSDSLQAKQNAAKKKVKAKVDAIMEDLVTLSKKACKVEDWTAASDLMISRAMKENEKLRKEFVRINNVRRNVDEIIAEYDLDDARDGLSIQECDLKLDEVNKEVEETVKSVEEEDNVRELYSMDDSKVDKIKLPTFSGKESEDYEKFKSDLLKGFAQNRVTQADKLDKLRECLYGEAKRLVPHSITSSVDDAIKVLDQAYGDPLRLFNYRQDYFFKLGKQPKKTEKGGYKAQVEWLRDVEVVMEGLLSLALKDKACASILFSVETMRKYLSSFDTYEFEKLVQCEGLGELRFRMWLFKVGQFRERAQSFAKETDTGSTVTNSRSSKVTPASGNSNRVNHSAKHQPTLAMFKLQDGMKIVAFVTSLVNKVTQVCSMITIALTIQVVVQDSLV